MEDKIPKHIKRKKSNTSSSKSKSNHKHEYVDALFMNLDNKVYKGKYCTLCGKINDMDLFTAERKDGYYHVLTSEELLKKYPDYEKVSISSYDQKYVTLIK